jgi:hypothetical protein
LRQVIHFAGVRRFGEAQGLRRPSFFVPGEQLQHEGKQISECAAQMIECAHFTLRRTMRKCSRYALAAEILAVALLSVPLPASQVWAQETDYSKVQIKTTKVPGNIYMLAGAGGNIAASVGEDGIVIVDDQYAPLAEKIQAVLKNLGITDKQVRFVINTHYHGDHTGGNTPFANSGSTVIAQDNVRKRLESGGAGGYSESAKGEIKPAEKTALPVIAFEHDVTVHLNGEDIRALHFPSGHTDGDSFSSRKTTWCTW